MRANGPQPSPNGAILQLKLSISSTTRYNYGLFFDVNGFGNLVGTDGQAAVQRDKQGTSLERTKPPFNETGKTHKGKKPGKPKDT